MPILTSDQAEYVRGGGRTIVTDHPEAWVDATGPCPTCDGKPWVTRHICCGREMDPWHSGTWDEADALRESYISAEGHDRQCIIEHCPDCIDGRKREALQVKNPMWDSPHQHSYWVTFAYCSVAIEPNDDGRTFTIVLSNVELTP